jgi:hypothetical protein
MAAQAYRTSRKKLGFERASDEMVKAFLPQEEKDEVLDIRKRHMTSTQN